MSNILDTLSPPALLAPAKPVEDCASCRVIGGLTGTGLGGYALVQAATQARALRASGPVAGGPTTRGLALMAAFGVGALLGQAFLSILAGCSH